MKRLGLASFVLVLTLWALPALAEELTLENAVKMALENNQLLLAAQESTAAAEWGFRRSISAWLPKASFQWAWSHPDPDTVDQADAAYELQRQYSPSAERSLWEENFTSSIVVTQPLFNGLGEYTSIAAGHTNRWIARYSEADEAHNLVRQVKQAYYAAAKSRALIQVARDSLQLAQESLKLTQARYEIGQAAQNEVLRLEAEVASAEGSVVDAENTYAQAMMALAHLIGQPLEGKYEPSEPTTVSAESMAAAERAAGAGDDSPLSINTHPAVRAAEGNVELAELEHEATWGSMLPSANLTYSYNWETNNTAMPDEDTSWTLGVSVSLPLFQGFSAVTGTVATSHQVQAARLQVEDYKRTLLQQAYAARLNLRASRLRVISAQKALKSATANVELVHSQLEVGMATNLQVLDAILALRNAESSLLNATADFHSAMADWEYLTVRAEIE